MDIVKVKLADLVLSEENVRMHPRRQIEEYKRSLEMFGQTKNAVIDEDNNVLIGNGLVMATRELGWTEIYAIRRTGLSKNNKLKLMVSDNKIWTLGVDNLDALDEVFKQLEGDLDIPGYDEETLKAMIGEAEAITAEIANYGKLSDEEIAGINNRPEATLKPPAQAATPAPQAANNESGHHATDSEGVVENHVVCPQCGVKIVLR